MAFGFSVRTFSNNFSKGPRRRSSRNSPDPSHCRWLEGRIKLLAPFDDCRRSIARSISEVIEHRRLQLAIFSEASGKLFSRDVTRSLNTPKAKTSSLGGYRSNALRHSDDRLNRVCPECCQRHDDGRM